MTKDIEYADTQIYLQHFRNKGCDDEIIAMTEGLFNLFWLNIKVIDQLKLELEKKKVNIARLKELIPGMNGSTSNDDEESKSKSEAEGTSSPPDNQNSSTEDSGQKPKGHGRRGVDDYPGAKTVVCAHGEHKEGDTCPQCHLGPLRLDSSKVRIQFEGHAPLTATRYELETLSCMMCPFTTTAEAPVDVTKKYTEKSKAVLAYLHYGMGLPYFRLAKMQEMLGLPIAASTQSELMASMMGPVHAMFNHLVFLAAQSDCLYQDDTGVKIQSLMQENKAGNLARKGMFTSGFIAEGEHPILLYFSGRAHAGENLDIILSQREEDRDDVICMADALSANGKHQATAHHAKCNSHAFRRFRSLLNCYPEAASFVLNIYGKVYDIDAFCKAQKMDSQARLTYHQAHSQPLMEELETWFNQVLTGDEVEPNGALATECQYLSNHWKGLTQFLRIPGAPLDNNALEAMLKYMIMYRKNSQFFRTAYSAEYGSRIISIIVTCMKNQIDAIDYLTQLQLNEQAVWNNPEAWTPWQYQQTLQMNVMACQAA